MKITLRKIEKKKRKDKKNSIFLVRKLLFLFIPQFQQIFKSMFRFRTVIF